MIVGVISDTHGLLRPEAVARLQGVDHVIHAGDVGAADILPALARIAPVTAVRGNVDLDDWADALPETVTADLDGHRVHLLHDRGALAISPRAEGIEVVIFGHSHRSLVERQDGVLYLNPGAAGPRRFRLPVTVARLDLTADPAAEIVHLDV